MYKDEPDDISADEQKPSPGITSSIMLEVVESDTQDGKKIRSRGIFLLPNALTTAALFAGFYAILSAAQGFFNQAAVAIFVAMIMDALDGRVARLTQTQSAFGAEYDSLSDVIAFGVAPAVLSFYWALSELGKAGWMVAFVYLACTALRLARFNTQSSHADNRFFLGLPSPLAAAWVVSFIWLGVDRNWSHPLAVFVLAAIVLLAAFLMVSRVRYQSFKEWDLRGRVPFVVMLVIVFIFAVVFVDPPLVAFGAALAYVCSGILRMYVFRKK